MMRSGDDRWLGAVDVLADGGRLLSGAHPGRSWPLVALLNIERHSVAASESFEVERAVEARPVEEVLPTVLGRDEPEPSVRLHLLDGAARHHLAIHDARLLEARSAPLAVVIGTSPPCDVPPAPPEDHPTRPADREAAPGRTAPCRSCSGTSTAARCARAPRPGAVSAARTQGRVPARARGGPARAAGGGRWESVSSSALRHSCANAAHVTRRQAAAPSGAGSPWSKRPRQRSQQRTLSP